MARIVVQTDNGIRVASFRDIREWHVAGLSYPTSEPGNELARGIREAVIDAEVIQAGGVDVSRPRER